MKPLEPCPFCGSKEIGIGYFNESVHVSCMKCKVRTRNYSKGTKEQKEDYAADAWNRRQKKDVEDNTIYFCCNCEKKFDSKKQGHIWRGDESNHGLFGLDDEAFAKLAVSWAGLGLRFCCMECEVNYYRGAK